MLDDRKTAILSAVVQEYIATAQPVGSSHIADAPTINVSSATVRNEMAHLEHEGNRVQPHTSAGRIPSQQGYRLYVDELLPAPGGPALQLKRELAGAGLQWAALEDLLQHLARRLADITGLLSLITRPQRPLPQLQAIRLVVSGERLLVFLVRDPALSTSLNLRLPAGSLEELPILERWLNEQMPVLPDSRIPWDRLPAELRSSGRLLRQALESHDRLQPRPVEGLVAAGLVGLLGQPEFSRSASLLPLVQLVEHGPQQVLIPDAATSEETIWIGSEHPHQALSQCAVVQASYSSGDGGRGQVALVGPMRMAYATARAAVRSVASILERLMN